MSAPPQHPHFDDASNKPAAAVSPTTTSSSSNKTLQLCGTIRQEMDNMGRALSCPLCLSTYNDAVMVPNCCHVFCRFCLTQALAHKACCPLCQQKCTKRSLVEDTRLSTLAIAYKVALRRLGLAPARYNPQITMMTQQQGGNNHHRSQQQYEATTRSLLEQLQLSRIMAQVPNLPPMVQKGQKQVVESNEQALLGRVLWKKQAAAAADPSQDSREEIPTATQMVREQCAADRDAGLMDDDDDHDHMTQEDDAPQRSPVLLLLSATHNEQEESAVDETTATNRRTDGSLPVASTPDSTNQSNLTSSVALPPAAVESRARMDNTRTTDDFTPFSIGTVVDVQPRTWPGMNKPGGVAKVTGYNLQEGRIPTYHVQYVLDHRKERNVDAIFVQPQRIHPPKRPSRQPTLFTTTTSSVNTTATAILPPSLVKKLKQEGFDTEGIVDPAVFQKTSKKKRVRIQEDDDAGPSVARKRPRTSLLQRVTNTVRMRLPHSTSAKKVAPLIEFKTTDAEAFALQRYQQLWKSLKGSITVLASGLPDGYQTKLLQLVKRSRKWPIRVNLAKTFSTKTSICVTMTEANGKVAKSRTLKSMQACLAGIPLVSTSWIDECIKTGSVQEPQAFLIQTLRSETSTGKADILSNGILYLAACLHSQPSFQLLKNYSVLIGGGFTPRQLELDVLSLLRQAGAKILTPASLKAKSKSSDPIVLICGDNAGSLPESSMRVLSQHKNLVVGTHHWWFDSLSAGKLLSTEDYEPNDTRAKAIWELTHA